MIEAILKIELGLQEATLAVLKSFAPQRIEITKPTEAASAVIEPVKVEVAPVDAKKDEPAQEAPAVPSPADVVNAVKLARKREPNPVSREAIEALIKTYGVTASREIPEDKRQEFLNKLSNL